MISIILVAIAGMANAVMDATRLKWIGVGCGSFWDWNTSHKRKWKIDDDGKVIHPREPRFFLSTSVLVFLTDSWHFFQQVMLAAFVAAIISYEKLVNSVVDMLIFTVIFSLSFHLLFHGVFEKYKIRNQKQ